MAIDPGTAIIIGSTASGLLGAGAANSAARSQAAASRAATAEQRRQFDLTYGNLEPYRQAGAAALNRLSSMYGTPVSYIPQSGPSSGYQGMDYSGGGEAPGAMGLDFGLANAGADLLGGSFLGEKTLKDDYASTSLFGSALAQLRDSRRPSTTQPVATQPVPSDPAGAPDYTNFFNSPDYEFRRSEGQKAIDRSMAARGRGLSGGAVKAGIDYASNLAAGEFGNYFNRQAALAGIGQTAVNTGGMLGANAANNIGANMMAAGNARGNAALNSANSLNNAIQGGISNYMLMDYLRPQGNFASAGGWQF